MANVNELKDVLKQTLEENGTLSQIRAKIRSDIFKTLNDNTQQKTPVSSENMLINELIREYMDFNNYNHSLAVFIPESGQPQQPPFDRNFIAKKLKIIEDKNTKDLPLLYGAVLGIKKMVSQDLLKGVNEPVSQRPGQRTQFADDTHDLNDTNNPGNPSFQNIFK